MDRASVALLDNNPGELKSRKAWREAAAAVLVHQLSMSAIHGIAAAGEDEFIRVSKPVYEGHAFRREDLSYIFGVVKAASQQNARIHPALILGPRDTRKH